MVRPKPPVAYGRAAADYAAHRQGFPHDFYARLRTLRVGLPGQRVLDLGTGTGLMAREFARRGCRVIGVDPSAELLAVAEATNLAEVIRVRYLRARAEATGLPDASFDVISAGTCWHEFDRAAAAREAARLLAPGGALVIAHLDWLALPGGVVARTLRLIERHGGAASPAGTFLYPEWMTDLIDAGFRRWEVLGGTTTLEYSARAWRGRVRASRRAAPVMTPEALAQFDTALGRMLTRTYPSGQLTVDHRLFALTAWR